jgi:HEAT repeat protein
MAKLSSAIVQRKLATLRDVEEALARQVLYGGDLATNLLEQAPGMDERALTALLAETQSLPPAPAGALPRSSADALALIPGDAAMRHGVYPLEKAGTRLVVAVSEPLKADVEQDLGFSLGVTIVQRVAPLIRIKEAICRDYGLPLDRRSHRVLAKLEGKPDPSPSLTPAPLTSVPDIASLPRPPSIPPLGLPAPTDMTPLYASAQGAIPALRPMQPIAIREPEPETRGPSIYDRVTSPAPPAPATSTPIPTLRAEPGPTLTTPSLKVGPDAQLGAERRGRNSSPPPTSAPTPSRRSTPPSARLSVHRPNLGAWTAENKQAERRSRSRHRGPYTAAAAEEDLLNADSRDVVLTALFDFACQYFEYSALFAVHGDLAEGRSAHGPGADHEKITGIGVSLDMPSALATARKEGHFSVQALAKDGLDGQLARDLERTRGKKVLLLPILVRARCVLIFYGDDGEEDVDLSLIGDVLAFAPLVASALENVIRKKKASLRQGAGLPPSASMGPSPRSRPILPSREERREALAAALETTLRRVSSRPPARGSRPPPIPSRRRSTPPASSSSPETARSPSDAPAADTSEFGEPRRADTPVHGTSARQHPPSAPDDGPSVYAEESELEDVEGQVASSDDAPEISVASAEVDWSPELESPGPVRPPALPDSQIVVPATRPVRAHSSAELRLPSIIVNVDQDIEALVTRLLEGDEKVMDRIVALGASAASYLVSRFPGPIRDADRLSSPEPASFRGPVLRALARIGLPAAPFLAVRSNDREPAVRAWATALLGEIASVDSATAVSRRVTDSSAEVRRAALEAGKLLQGDEDARTALRDKVLSIAEGTSSVESRVAAIEALAHFRDGRAVPRLVRLLANRDEVGQSAEWALGVLTRQAFDRDTAAWEAWWKEKGGQHRIEWLIDSLTHDDIEIRRAAGEELKSLTKEYFGYYDDLPKGERQKAQRRYREWWDTTGKTRFPR